MQNNTIPHEARIHRGHWTRISPTTAYRLAQLRLEVFIQEQGITSEPELDGADLEPHAESWWIEDEQGVPISSLRTLVREDGTPAITRVVTAASARGRGLAGQLMRAALEGIGDQPVEVHAQAYLEQWYGGFGFRRVGEPFDEAGIPHLLMVREP